MHVLRRYGGEKRIKRKSEKPIIKEKLECTQFKSGYIPWNKGKINTMSNEGKNKIIESNKNRIYISRTPESRLKTSKSNKGKTRSIESKKRMSESAKLCWKRRKENGSFTTS